MQNLQSGDEKGQRAFVISDGGIGINLAGMRNEGMTEQRLVLLSWGRASVSKYGKNEKDMPDGGIITNRTEVKRQIEEEIIGVDQGSFLKS